MPPQGIPEGMNFFQWLFQLGIGLEGNWDQYATGEGLSEVDYRNLFNIATREIGGLDPSNPVRAQYFDWLAELGAIQGGDIQAFTSGQFSTGEPVTSADFANIVSAATTFFTAAGGGGSGAGPTPSQRALITEVVGGGEPEVWYNPEVDKWYLAYIIPDTDVPLLYEADATNLEALFGQTAPRFDRQITTAEIASRGGIYAGMAEDPFGDPYPQFIEMMEKEAVIKPWLRDPDMVAIMFEAVLEKREVQPAELMQTNWWQTHNESQRAWLILNNADPAEAEARIEATLINTRTQLEAMGMASPPDDVVEYMAMRLLTGDWTQGYWNNQIRAISDPYADVAMDTGLKEVVDRFDTLDTTRLHEERVRDEVNTWLGPIYGNWNDQRIAEWAGKLRNDPDAFDELTAMLRAQRSSLFPDYNENLTYRDISGPWINLWENLWGQEVDEGDPLFLEILRSGDYNEAAMKLRREGLKRNVSAVRQSLEGAAVGSGQLVRRTF